MFLEIRNSDVYISGENFETLKVLDDSFFINLNQIIEIKLKKFDLKNYKNSYNFTYMVEFYVLEDEIWNYMTLYFTQKSHGEYEKIKRYLKDGVN